MFSATHWQHPCQHHAHRDGWSCAMRLDISYLAVIVSLRLHLHTFSLPKTSKSSQSLPGILSPSMAWPFCMSEAGAKQKSQPFPSLSEQWARQEIKAHSNLAHGIIKVNENNVLLTGELCHAAAGRRARVSQELFTGAEERRGRGSSCLF